MKKKLVSILLSGALLASSLLATFTVVAAGNTAPVGETAVPAVTAAPAEETAAPAETAPAEAAPAEVAAPEAAPAEVAAPAAAAAPEVATVAADVPMPIAEGTTKTVEQDGKKYNVTVIQDFEGDTADAMTAVHGSVSVVDSAIGGTKSASYDGTGVSGGTKFTDLSFKTSASELQGDGLYVEVYTDDTNGVGGNSNQAINLKASGSGFSRYGYPNQIGFSVKGADSVTLNAPQVIMIPWSKFNNDGLNAWNGALNIETANEKLAAEGPLWVAFSWNQANASFALDSGKVLYFDNIGFYSEVAGVKADNSYTAYQNPFTSDSDAATGDGDEFNVAVADGVATFTLKQDLRQWNHRNYLKLGDAGLTATQYIDFDVTYGEAVPQDIALTLRLASEASNSTDYNVGGGSADYLAANSAYITGNYPNFHYHVPAAAFTLKNNKTLADAKWLTLNFATNASFDKIPAGSTATFAYSNLKVVESETVTFPEGTKLVNVNPTATGGTFDLAVTDNGDHAINKTGLTGAKLQLAENASVTLTAHPDLGMETVWTGIPGQVGEVKQDSVTFTVSGDAEIAPVATFNQLPGITIRATSEESVEITVASEGSSSTGMLSGITKDKEVTLTAPAKSGSKTFSCWKHKDNIISYEHEMKVLAKDTTAYTAVYADEPQEAKSTLTFYSITKDSAHSQVVAVFEWHLTSGDVEGKHIGEVKLNITGNGDSTEKTFKAFEIKKQNGYYTLTITFTGDIPDDLTFTITLEGIDGVTATSTVDMISGI